MTEAELLVIEERFARAVAEVDCTAAQMSEAERFYREDEPLLVGAVRTLRDALLALEQTVSGSGWRRDTNTARLVDKALGRRWPTSP